MTHPDHPEGSESPQEEPGRPAGPDHRPRRGASEAARRADQRWLVTAFVLGLLLVLGVLWVVYTIVT